MKNKFIITLLGYNNSSGNTCWYPWNKFNDVFKHYEYEVEWDTIDKIKKSDKPRVFITWNQPDAIDIIQTDIYNKNKDIILQKVVGDSPRFENLDWGKTYEETENRFYNHNFLDYQMVLDLYKNGHNIYAFGAKTSNTNTPIKKTICDSLGDRMIMIPWGSCLFDYKEIQEAKPITSGFLYDIGYVGSIWNIKNRGNRNNIERYLKLFANSRPPNRVIVTGDGTGRARVDNQAHKEILKKSKICPIINSDSWKIMGGVQDRFWSVFASGRFGVADTEGVYEFYNKDEVVVCTDPNEYYLKSHYYLNNINKQIPFIEKALKRIKSEYNYYNTWKKILSKLGDTL